MVQNRCNSFFDSCQRTISKGWRPIWHKNLNGLLIRRRCQSGSVPRHLRPVPAARYGFLSLWERVGVRADGVGKTQAVGIAAGPCKYESLALLPLAKAALDQAPLHG